jgi:hypothetical protein
LIPESHRRGIKNTQLTAILNYETDFVVFSPHSARNGRGQTIKKQAQGGDSSAGKQEKRNLKCEDEEPTN